MLLLKDRAQHENCSPSSKMAGMLLGALEKTTLLSMRQGPGLT